MGIPTHGMLRIYSNDGSTSLYYNGEATSGASYIVNKTGLMDRADRQVYTYTGDKKFIGFATTANATEPTYAIGDSTSSIVAADFLNLYIVEEEIADVPRIIYNNTVIAELSDKEITITCAGKKMLSDIVIVNPVGNEAEEEGLYFYIDGTKFVLPEEGITFRTLLKNYGTVNGSNIMYYGEGSTGIWSKCIYADSEHVNTSLKTVFYSEGGGGVQFGLLASLMASTLDSTIVTGGEYFVISGGGSN